jgi:hypothetical protein
LDSLALALPLPLLGSAAATTIVSLPFPACSVGPLSLLVLLEAAALIAAVALRARSVVDVSDRFLRLEDFEPCRRKWSSKGVDSTLIGRAIRQLESRSIQESHSRATSAVFITSAGAFKDWIYDLKSASAISCLRFIYAPSSIVP